MKPRKETRIENAFTIETIIGMYHVRLQGAADDKNEGVSYDFWQLLYLDHGRYIFQLDDTTHALSSGQLILCKPGTLRRSLCQQDAVIAIISFRCRSENLSLIAGQGFALSDEMRSNLSSVLTAGVASFQEIDDEEPFFGQKPGGNTTIYGLQALKNRLELLLIDLYENQDVTSRTMPLPQNQLNYYERQFRQIESFLYSRLDQALTIHELSEQTGFSVSTIKRICKRQIGCGVIHYFIILKMKEAKRFIRETDMSFSQISDALGFSDIHYFSKTFKRITGLSPREYAKSVLKN